MRAFAGNIMALFFFHTYHSECVSILLYLLTLFILTTFWECSNFEKIQRGTCWNFEWTVLIVFLNE